MPPPPSTISWTAFGPDAILLRFADRADADAFPRGQRIAQELDRHPPDGLIEWIPGFTTLLLVFQPSARPRPAEQAPRIVTRLSQLPRAPLPPGKLHQIPVRYDGEDLAELAAARDLTVPDVIRLHATPLYHVHLLGFAPGFPYLGELDPRLHTPRRSSPRPIVRAGTVAIGGEHTGIYSVDGPGGWNLIGHTTTVLFDPSHDSDAAAGEDMFLLRPGDRVQFLPIE